MLVYILRRRYPLFNSFPTSFFHLFSYDESLREEKASSAVFERQGADKNAGYSPPPEIGFTWPAASPMSMRLSPYVRLRPPRGILPLYLATTSHPSNPDFFMRI